MNATILTSATLPPLDSNAIESIHLLLRCFRVTRTAAMATTTLVLYDALTTFDSEWRLVWRARWSTSKVMFLVNRYLAPLWFFGTLYLSFVHNPSNKRSGIQLCNIGQKINLLGGMVLLALQSAFFVSRVWAIYGRTRRSLFIITGLFGICTGPGTVIVIIKLFHTNAHNSQYHEYLLANPAFDGAYSGCYFTAYPKNIYIMFISSVLNEIILFVAIAWKYFSQETFNGVFRFLYFEETVYLLVMTPVLISGLAFSLSGPIGFAMIGSGFSLACKTALTSRMLLRLKLYLVTASMGIRPQEELTDPETNLEIRFASIPPKFFPTGMTATGHERFPDTEFDSRIEGLEMGVIRRPTNGNGSSGWEAHDIVQQGEAGGLVVKG